MIGACLVLLVEAVLLAVLLVVVLPTRRRAGLIAAGGMLLALFTGVTTALVQGGLLALMFAQPNSGPAAGSEVMMVMGAGMVIGEVVPPVVHAIGMGCLAWAIREVVAVMEDRRREPSRPAQDSGV